MKKGKVFEKFSETILGGEEGREEIHAPSHQQSQHKRIIRENDKRLSY